MSHSQQITQASVIQYFLQAFLDAGYNNINCCKIGQYNCVSVTIPKKLYWSDDDVLIFFADLLEKTSLRREDVAMLMKDVSTCQGDGRQLAFPNLEWTADCDGILALCQKEQESCH